MTTPGRGIYVKMNNPALKGEVSINKMLKLTNPRLRRSNVVLNSFSGCVSDAAKELSRTPEVSSLKIVSQPGMFMQKLKGAVTFEQLQSFADTHGYWHLNKQVDMVNSDVKFINFEPFPVSHLSDKELAINFNAIELHRVHGIFGFPDKMEGILSKGVFSTFQIHFLSPEHSSNYVQFNSGGLVSRPSVSNHLIELNLEDGDSSLGLKAEVSSPLM